MEFQFAKTSAPTPELIREIGQMRVQVWRADGASFAEGRIENERWVDEIDSRPTTIFWTVRHQGRLIASARLSFHRHLEDIPDYERFSSQIVTTCRSYAVLGRLVVHPDWRRRGLAGQLDRLRLEEALLHEPEAVLVYAVGRNRAYSLVRWGFCPIARYQSDEDLQLPRKPEFITLAWIPTYQGANTSLKSLSGGQYPLSMAPDKSPSKSAATR